MEGTTWITEDVLLLYEAQWWRHYTCVNMVREKVINARQKLNNCDYSHNVVNLYSFLTQPLSQYNYLQCTVQ